MSDRGMIGLISGVLLAWLAIGFYILLGNTALLIALIAFMAPRVVAGPFAGIFVIWMLIRWLNSRDDPRHATCPPDDP
jgi:hypothetical protein